MSEAGDVAHEGHASNTDQERADLDNASDYEEEEDAEDNTEITTDDLDDLFVKALAITVDIKMKEIDYNIKYIFFYSSTPG